MKIAIRVDSSTQMGTGHLMRCLTLADELRIGGAEVFFICRNLPGNINHLVEKKGHKLFQLRGFNPECHAPACDSLTETLDYSSWLGVSWEEDAHETGKILAKERDLSWLIVDHYALDRQWEKCQRPYIKKIMVLDDLANREHDCDLLLDQNLYINMNERYKNLVAQNCRLMLGPEFVLLRREFIQAKKRIKRHLGDIKKVFVFFGGADLTNETSKVLSALGMIEFKDFSIDVVIGPSNPYKEEVRKICEIMTNTNFYYNIYNIAELMLEADLAICGGGSNTWERCCLGLPSLIISVALNQVEISQACNEFGLAIYLGTSENVSVNKLKNKVTEIIKKPNLIRNISCKSANVITGDGTIRVAKEILKG